MKMFKRMLAMLLLTAVALLPVAGLGEEETKSEAEDAFETLRTLMEKPLSESIPEKKGSSLYAEVKTVEDAKAVSDNTPPTPVDIVCQIYFDNGSVIIASINDVPVDELTANNVDVKDIITSREITEGAENYRLYEAVSYTDLNLEHMLYYAYIISSNYETIQDQLPFGMTFLIVVKYGDNGLIMINDENKAEEFTESVKKVITNLTSGN